MIKIKFESGESKEFNLTTFGGSDLSNLKLHTSIFEGYSLIYINFNYKYLFNVNFAYCNLRIKSNVNIVNKIVIEVVSL